MQDLDNIKPGYPLFTGKDYQDAFARKRVFEEAYSPEKIKEVFQWTITEEYSLANSDPYILNELIV